MKETEYKITFYASLEYMLFSMWSKELLLLLWTMAPHCFIIICWNDTSFNYQVIWRTLSHFILTLCCFHCVLLRFLFYFIFECKNIRRKTTYNKMNNSRSIKSGHANKECFFLFNKIYIFHKMDKKLSHDNLQYSCNWQKGTYRSTSLTACKSQKSLIRI